MDEDNDNDIMDSDPCVIGYRLFVYCEPLHKYVFNAILGTIIYYCGQNNTITLDYSQIYSVAPRCKFF
jgi:hypothetical protein